MQVSISSLQIHTVNRCGTIRHLLIKLSFLRKRRNPNSTLFPYTTLFRSRNGGGSTRSGDQGDKSRVTGDCYARFRRSEEHTSELQSHSDLVCRLLLEKKKLADP